MITIEFSRSVSRKQQDVFLAAANRLDSIVDTSFDPINVDGQILDGVLIEASVLNIDGRGGVLGRAGPTLLHPVTELPIKGIMQFDRSDLKALEQQDSFRDVILHEMAHVLGFGTLWARLGLVKDSGTSNPRFLGQTATDEYSALSSGQIFDGVPIANTGGAGTREGHWRELVFGDELLTGFLSGIDRPISRMSVGSFQDIGYQVDFTAADPYGLPTFLELAEKGITEAVIRHDLCRVERPEPVVFKSDKPE